MNSTEMTEMHVADLAGVLDLHMLKPGTDRCAACGETSPCGTRTDAERSLYLIGYMRCIGPDQDHPLIDRAHHITWLREEIRKRDEIPDGHPDQEIAQSYLKDLRLRLAASETHLVEAIHANELPGLPATGQPRHIKEYQ